MKSLTTCINAVKASTDFELINSELKKRYLICNIILFNEIANRTKGYCGSFGTGYPFYVLGQNLIGNLPIIEEQIRYNNEILNEIENSNITHWNCAECLEQFQHIMPDLKQICKPCPNIDHEFKPRKVLNRLPDIDLWSVCEDERIFSIKDELSNLFNYYGMYTSDTDPLKTMDDIIEIVEQLKNGIIPTKKLPLDSHIIGYIELYNLIEQVPYILKKAKNSGEIPYLPIHPLSLRKTWQYDDTPYNFIHDYLSSLTQFNFTDELNSLLNETREYIASNYSFEELYDFLITSGPESVLRRHRTKELKDRFKERIESWKK